MKFLIVTADDMGADRGRNEGIAEAVLSGSVTSLSILANGPACAHALSVLQKIKNEKLSVGAHINLSEGKPLSKGLKLLTDRRGMLLKKRPAHQFLLKRTAELEAEIAAEVEAQISFLKDHVDISHLDGHQHVHLFPAAFRAVAAASLKHAIPWIRVPDEPFRWGEYPGVDEMTIQEAGFFTHQAKNAGIFFKKQGLRTTDGFRGLFFKQKLSLQVIEKMAETLPEGVTELMVHPGRVCENGTGSEFSGFSTADRETELNVLLSPDFRRILEKNAITVCSFSEL